MNHKGTRYKIRHAATSETFRAESKKARAFAQLYETEDLAIGVRAYSVDDSLEDKDGFFVASGIRVDFGVRNLLAYNDFAEPFNIPANQDIDLVFEVVARK